MTVLRQRMTEDMQVRNLGCSAQFVGWWIGISSMLLSDLGRRPRRRSDGRAMPSQTASCRLGRRKKALTLAWNSRLLPWRA